MFADPTEEVADPKLERLLNEHPTPEGFCAKLSKIFKVRVTEVALLHAEGGLLRFLFPGALRTVGTIPLPSTSSVAAHTATTRKLELFNNFTKVRHAAVFESVRLGKPEDGNVVEEEPIQKLMSAPILDAEGNVMGVLQISRKGATPNAAGPDFTMEDLQQLGHAAKVAAKTEFMRETSKDKASAAASH
jgi:GAF domain